MDPSQFPPTLEPPPRLAWAPLTLTLLAPPLVAVAGVFALETREAANGLLTVYFLSGTVCWLLFGRLLSRRYHGPSLWLMFFAYPFAQLGICLTIAAAACLVSLRM